MKPDAIEQLLPEVFRRTLGQPGVLSALLEVMAAMHGPSEQILGEIEKYFDPYRTPDQFVSFLASWVDLDRFFISAGANGEVTDRSLPLAVGRLRELVAAALELSQWRGTCAGLQRLLQTATGVTGFVINERVPDGAGVPIPFHIEVCAPEEAKGYRSLIERILEQEKPVYVTCKLTFTAELEGMNEQYR